ncbi:MAG: disulfide bond formation protein B [Alphaproteobacteria bacterium]|nr:disulfide bond formation protein B [Alphaproteobacteria bacterium]
MTKKNQKAFDWESLFSLRFASGLVLGVSLFSLLAALVAQYGFGLAPCILCLLQRVPYGVAAFLGAAGLFFASKNQDKHGALVLNVAAFVFFLNALTAFYHSGVERHWWMSFLESCKGSAGSEKVSSAKEMLSRLETIPAVPCDQIPWADPVFGLSMANDNVMLCCGLTVFCLLAARRILKAGQP